MYQPDKIYENEEAAKEAAAYAIMEILSNPSYQEDDKFDKLLNSYLEIQNDTDKKIQLMIQEQIDALNQTKNFMDLCFGNVDKCEQQIVTLNEEFEKDSQFHRELVSYEKIFFYRKNIGLMLDQMKYIFSVQEQIDKMNQAFESGNENYESLHYKLIALVDIRDNIIEAVNTSPQYKQDLGVILSEFKCLSDFETRFYDKLYEIFLTTLEASIKLPQQLIKVLQIIETADKSRELRKKDSIYKKRAITTIQTGIDEKFNNKLKDAKDAVQILESSKFTSGDLILAYDHTVKCFPKHYNIFKIFEDQYKLNVEKRILPFLEDEQKVTESFGTLINLLSWVDSYEQLLSRVGEQSESYVELRCRVKSYMPIFQDHVNNLIIDYSEKAINKDKCEQQTNDNINKLIRTKQDLLTYFPEDIFHFINQQLDILGPKLKGEIFVEFIRSVCNTLAELLKTECKNFINELPTQEVEGETSPLYLIVLQTNNFYKCMTYSNETKQYCLQFCDKTISERIEQIFYQDLTSSFNESINLLLDKMCKIVFNEVIDQIVPSLFTPKWQNENLIDQALLTIKDYLSDIQLLMLNQIHFNKLVKQVFKLLTMVYIEQLIFTTQFVAGIAKGIYSIKLGFFPKYLTNLSFVNEQDKDKKKKEKDRKAAIHIILSNKELMVPQMQRDKEVILNCAEQDYVQQLGKAGLSQVEKVLSTIIKSINNSKSELDSLIQQYPVCFEQNSLYIFEVVMWMREDCDQKYKQTKMDALTNLMNAK